MSTPTRRFTPTQSSTRSSRRWLLITSLLALVTSVDTVVRFWYWSAPFPPGLDGAQWLSYGRAFFGGAGRGATATYAPLVPVVAHLLGTTAGPALGIQILGISILVLLGAAVWLLSAQVLGPTWGSLVAALVIPATALAEPFFYGGYPQQAALAFGIFGIAALVQASQMVGPIAPGLAVALGTIAFLLASASHLMYGPILLASGAIAALALGRMHKDRCRFIKFAAGSLAPAAAVSTYVAWDYVARGYRPPLDASHRALPDAWVYATREAPWIWGLIVIGGFILALPELVGAANKRRRREDVRTHEATVVGLALALPATALFLASGQPRLVPPIILGCSMLVAHAARSVVKTHELATFVVIVGWSSLTLWLAVMTTAFSRDFASFYQELDASLVNAAGSIPSSGDESIAVMADQRGWPTGWWVEALQDRKVLTGSDLQWLAFPEEKAQASTVTTLSNSPDADTLADRARAAHVRYFIARKWDWIGWEAWLLSGTNAPSVVYDDNTTIVLDIAPTP